jgi:hypothetical protein
MFNGQNKYHDNPHRKKRHNWMIADRWVSNTKITCGSIKGTLWLYKTRHFCKYSINICWRNVYGVCPTCRMLAHRPCYLSTVILRLYVRGGRPPRSQASDCKTYSTLQQARSTYLSYCEQLTSYCRHTYTYSNSTEGSPWVDKLVKEFSAFCGKSRKRWCVDSRPPPVAVLCQLKQSTLSPYSFMFHFDIILQPTPRPLKYFLITSVFPNKKSCEYLIAPMELQVPATLFSSI